MLIDDCHSNWSLFNSQIFNLEIGEKAHGQVMDGLWFFPSTKRNTITNITPATIVCLGSKSLREV